MTTDTRKQSPAADNGQIDRVEQFKFEPIKGYPMLHWHGKRPFTSTQYYPAQHKETYGSEVDGWRNKIYWGDNLQVMSHLLKQYRGKIRLVYIDPPFDSKADYKKKISLKGNSLYSDLSVFEEKQYSDIWTNDEYLQFMYERLILIKELLSSDGAIYLHCDPNKGHYLKILLDEIFGPENFQAEISWKKTTKTTSFTNYGSEHDTILFYSKAYDSFVFNQVFKPLKDSELQTKYIYLERPNGEIIKLNKEQREGKNLPVGKRLRGVPLLNMNPNRPNLRYEFLGHTKVWATSKERMQRMYDNGKIFQIDGGLPQKKGYLDENKGAKVNDVWDDINSVNSQALERTDYPTQKPEALLERIITVSSNSGDLVFDCFMGSGTTQAVAMKLGRRFIGADINLGAVQITTKRLIAVGQELSAAPPAAPSQTSFANDEDDEDGEAATPVKPTTFYTGFDVYNVNNYDIFRNPVEAKDLLLQALEVNPIQAGSLFDGEKDGRMVKIMPVNRIATRQDLNELITGFDYRAFERRQAASPNQPVEKITLVCMGHEPGLAAYLRQEVPYKLDVEVVDILRDKQDIQFKRDSEAKIIVQNGHLVIEKFYPMNLLSKLSMEAERVDDWRELVESVMIDWNYDGAVLQPAVIDIPDDNALVAGRYPIPADAGTIRVKITDLLSESLEQEVRHG